MKLLNRLTGFFLFAALLTACGNNDWTQEGDTLHRYESSGTVNILSNYSSNVGFATSKIYLDNANPYPDLVGAQMRDALAGTTDGEADRISELTLTNIHIEEVEVYSGFDTQNIADYLTGAELRYAQDGNEQTERVLATLSSVSMADSEVVFNLSGADITAEVNNDWERLYFWFEWEQNPPEGMDVQYEVLISYEYSYTVNSK